MHAEAIVYKGMSVDPPCPSGLSPAFAGLSPSRRQVTYVLLTRAPRYSSEDFRVRLACVRHAASVRSEPGSNSPKKLENLSRSIRLFGIERFPYSPKGTEVRHSTSYLVFKDQTEKRAPPPTCSSGANPSRLVKGSRRYQRFLMRVNPFLLRPRRAGREELSLPLALLSGSLIHLPPPGVNSFLEPE